MNQILLFTFLFILFLLSFTLLMICYILLRISGVFDDIKKWFVDKRIIKGFLKTKQFCPFEPCYYVYKGELYFISKELEVKKWELLEPSILSKAERPKKINGIYHSENGVETIITKNGYILDDSNIKYFIS